MATSPNGPHNNYVGATYIQNNQHGCKFCGDATITPKAGSATWGCGNNVTGIPQNKVTAICSKTNGPHNNVVGAQYHIKPINGGCSFCGAPRAGGGYACGLSGTSNGTGMAALTSICTNLGQPAAPVAASNGPKLLDPKENRIGNVIGYEPHCQFCGCTAINRGRRVCGLSTTGGRIIEICQQVGLNKSLLPAKPEKMDWVKPTVNCPACGAYCAHKHRIGCKAVVTC